MSTVNNRFVQGIQLALESSVLFLRNLHWFFLCFMPLFIATLGIATILMFPHSFFPESFLLVIPNDAITEQTAALVSRLKLVDTLFRILMEAVNIVCQMLCIKRLAKVQNITLASLDCKLLYGSIATAISLLCVVEYLSRVSCSGVLCVYLTRLGLPILRGLFIVLLPAVVVGSSSIGQAIRISCATFYAQFWVIIGGVLSIWLIGYAVILLGIVLTHFPHDETVIFLLGFLLRKITFAALMTSFTYLLYVKTHLSPANVQ